MSKMIASIVAFVALFVVVQSQTLSPLTAPNFNRFPFTLDGSFIWIASLNNIRTPTVTNEITQRHGADYFDYVCQQSGPRGRTPYTLGVVDGESVNNWYARAIICSNGVTRDTAGRGTRTAGQFFSYAASSKPVYAFDAYSRPTQFVRIANNPNALFAIGVDRTLSSTVTSGGGFRTFYGNSGVVIGETEVTPDRALATFPAWTGCNGNGIPYSGFTCNDWSSVDSGIRGAVGSPGYSTQELSGSQSTQWLDITNPSIGDQACNTPSLFIYCGWIPTADDGFQNGDETSIDCGGTTKLVDGGAQRQCGPCPPGSAGPFNGPCVQCLANRFSFAGGETPCQTCAVNAFSGVGATSCQCNPGYALPANYDINTMARDGSLCVALIRGDPQITGLQGQDFQVHGIPDEYFNMVSTPEMQVNSRFVFLQTARCMDNTTTCFTHPGTYIDVMTFSSGSHKVKVLAGTYEQGLRAFIGETEIQIGDKQVLASPSVTVQFLSKSRVLVQNGLFRFVLVNSDNFMNQEVALLDNKLLKLGAAPVKVAAGETAPHAEIPIHGILGQTWQNIAYPSGMFIEGEVADYRVNDGAFGTDFVYNKYQA